MRIYGKILFSVLPFFLFSMIALGGINYHFSRTALLTLGKTWLGTCLSDGLRVVEVQEKTLRHYQLDAIEASVLKAQMDAIYEVSIIRVGGEGRVFGVTGAGEMMIPGPVAGKPVSETLWFRQLQSGGEGDIFRMEGRPYLARYTHFEPWDWYVLAVAPLEEIYGAAMGVQPMLIGLCLGVGLLIALGLMEVTRRLTRPLSALVKGAEKIGRGELDIRIPIRSRDEFGHLAQEFNHMSLRLKESLTALQYSEEYFRALIENAADMTWILDARGHFVYVSPSTQRILGHSPESLLGEDRFSFAHPRERDALVQRFKTRVMAVETSFPVEHRFRHGQGHWCVIESISTNLLSHPAVKGFVINSRDITRRKEIERALKQSHTDLEARVEERTRALRAVNRALNAEVGSRKQKEAELAAANRAKGEFLANISHEIRTPLGAVMGFSYLLEDTIQTPLQRQYLDRILDSGNALLEMLNGLLDLSCLEAGTLEMQCQQTEIGRLLKGVGEMFQLRMDAKQLSFSFRVSPEVPRGLWLDDLRLRQVITNMVDNALKFTEEGSIGVVARLEPSPPSHGVHLVIEVRDTGIGIPRDKLEKIFDAFQQVSEGAGRRYGGAGLGLAICHRLVSLMGGWIDVESQGGQGSCFSIHIPGVGACSPRLVPHPEGRFTPLPARATDPLSLELPPELLLRVQRDILPRLPQASDGMIMADVQNIAQALGDLGGEFGSGALVQISGALIQAVHSFDVEKISAIVARLAKL